MPIEIIAVIIQFLTLFAIALGAFQLLFHSRQMHRDFETLYVQRYWAVMDERSAGWIARDKFSKNDLAVARKYLSLCEDEIDLRSLGRVSDNTRGFWALAIMDQARLEPYSTELAAAHCSSYRGIRNLMETGKDPLQRRKAWRALRGL